MSSTQVGVIGLLMYFVIFNILVFSLVQSGLLEGSGVGISSIDTIDSQSLNTSASTTIPSASPWNLVDHLSALIGIGTGFGGMNLGLGVWNYVIALLFVWLPLTMLFLSILYIVRGM